MRVVLLLFACVVFVCASMPSPWSHPLARGDSGNGVLIMTSLLARSPFVASVPSSVYDAVVASSVSSFQKGNGITPNGIFGAQEFSPSIVKGYKYLIYIPVWSNRSVETAATLYDSNMVVKLVFQVRTHGQDALGNAINEFSSDGSTPSGVMEVDLNSPEGNPVLYGPYPINRVVHGLAGNAAFMLQNSTTTPRSGILLHTGEWQNWVPSEPMPNSHGCIHSHPTYINQIWQILVSELGVEIRKNEGGVEPYPHAAQGILVIDQID